MEHLVRQRKSICRLIAYGIICLYVCLSGCELVTTQTPKTALPADSVIIETQYLPNYRDTLQSVYLSQVGVRETTGNNDGTEVEAYLKSTGLGKGYAWCASFVTWCHIESDIEAVKSAWSPAWFADTSKIVYRKSWINTNYTSQPGQVFGLYFNSKKRVAHVGFIYYEDSDNYYTIEGNTNTAGSREGDGVYKKIRPKKSIYIISDYVTP